MPFWGAVVGGAVSLIGGAMSSDAAGDAADAQAASAAQANDLQKYMYDTTRTDNQPLLDARNNALAQYQSLLPGLTKTFDASSVANDPGYQFGLQQGQATLNNQAASAGSLYSGNQLRAAAQYGNDYGSTKFNDAFNRNLATNNFTANQYQSLIGAGQSGVNQINSAGQNYANQASNNLTSAGNARASGYVGSANAWNTALGGGYNAYQNNQLLGMLGRTGNASYTPSYTPGTSAYGTPQGVYYGDAPPY